jgi:hypothetical protein
MYRQDRFLIHFEKKVMIKVSEFNPTETTQSRMTKIT